MMEALMALAVGGEAFASPLVLGTIIHATRKHDMGPFWAVQVMIHALMAPGYISALVLGHL